MATEVVIQGIKHKGISMDVLGRPPGHIVAPENRQPVVTEWVGDKDWVNCPPNYSAWARQYRDYTRFYLSKYCTGPWLDDMVQEIMERFVQRDSLGVFCSDWETRSESGRSNFRSYYIRFLVTYAPGKNRNHVRRAKREMLLCDAVVASDGPRAETTWIERRADAEAPADGGVGAEHAFEELVAELRAVAPEPLTPVIDALVEAALDGADLRTTELAAALGCTSRTAAARLAEVRSVLAERLAAAPG